MVRGLALAAVVLAATLAAAGTAVADPGGDGVLCNFTLSDPQLVTVSGTQMVTATVTPAACTGIVKPISSQVCISTPTRAGRCTELSGFDAAQVYFSPYEPGTSYTAKGRGCSAQTRPPAAVCTTLGPRTVTL